MLDGDYRGLTDPHTTPLEVRVAGRDARFGILSDIDDTILETGVQRVVRMIRQTLAGSALTRSPFPGAAELYRDLAAGSNPVFYVSSSPWNLHAFLVAFLRHHGFPLGPVLLRDLLGTAAGREQKAGRIREILDLHPQLPFVLIGDSAEKDPEIYADIVRAYPGRILAVYIREVRLDPGDGRVEKVSGVGARRAVRARARQRRRARARPSARPDLSESAPPVLRYRGTMRSGAESAPLFHRHRRTALGVHNRTGRVPRRQGTQPVAGEDCGAVVLLEDAVAAGAHDEAEHDEHDAHQNASADQSDDAVDHEGDGDEPEDECHWLLPS